MSVRYQPQTFEKKWIGVWEKEKIYQAPAIVDKKKKLYVLIEFPYPSGAGLHVGHARSWSAMDAYARAKRMQGYKVLYPIGWDAFGLPAENYAIKMKIHPSKTVAENIARFKNQCRSLGLSFDWSREINTTDPAYYKWTQWIFIQLFKKGLAYRAKVPVNWCPYCKTNLADEEVLANGAHERCGKKTEKRPQEQWLLKITRYADRLVDDLAGVDYSEQIAKQQVNWIGRSQGLLIEFPLCQNEKITVFTTRPETTDGASFLVLAPEHPLVKKILKSQLKITNKIPISNFRSKEIKKYVERAQKKSEEERKMEEKKKTGVFTGYYAVNPVTGKKIPVWIADYVLMDYGTGAIMAVPYADERDRQFARAYDLPIEKTSFKAKPKGEKKVNYHLRDWIFSRQHYWGEPIPMVFCQDCADKKISWFSLNKSNSTDSLRSQFHNSELFGWFPVPEDQLPIKLPYVKSYEPTETGASPLAKIAEFVKTQCPNCGAEARRETDTMPNWAGSNWYFIRYLDNKNDKAMAAKEKMNCWLPVDIYQGGFEHTTLHLLYSRFIYKFLYDIGVVPTKEPYAKRRSHGIVLGPDGRKMSKSFGNVINPDDIVKEYGADTIRIYEMFIGPFDQTVVWNDEAVNGVYRFLTKVWQLFCRLKKDKEIQSDPEARQRLAKLIRRFDHDLERLKFNTMVSACMEFANYWAVNKDKVGRPLAKDFLKILAPLAPFLAEEIWRDVFGEKQSIHLSQWPKAEKITDEEIIIPVQVNGKLRSTIKIQSSKSKIQKEMENLALKDEKVRKYLEGKKYQAIYVPGKIINFVTS